MSNMLDISEHGGDPTWLNLDNVLTVGIIRRPSQDKSKLGIETRVVVTTSPARPGIVLPLHISIDEVVKQMDQHVVEVNPN